MIRIFLIGYMGAGKTTLGKSLARRMNLRYIDTDHFIENRYHKKIGDIFDDEGEVRFREIEHRVLLEIAEFEDVVISTGGGLPCFNNNMTIMNNKGTTVYLDVPVEELAARLGVSKTVRPLLKKRSGSELIEFIKENINVREPYYKQSKIRIYAGRMSTKNEVERLSMELEYTICK